jgi:hypothetical protein
MKEGFPIFHITPVICNRPGRAGGDDKWQM